MLLVCFFSQLCYLRLHHVGLLQLLLLAPPRALSLLQLLHVGLKVTLARHQNPDGNMVLASMCIAAH